MVFSPSECWNREKIQNRRDREGEAPAEPHGPRTCQDSGSPSQFLTAPPTFVHPSPHCRIARFPLNQFLASTIILVSIWFSPKKGFALTLGGSYESWHPVHRY